MRVRVSIDERLKEFILTPFENGKFIEYFNTMTNNIDKLLTISASQVLLDNVEFSSGEVYGDYLGIPKSVKHYLNNVDKQKYMFYDDWAKTNEFFEFIKQNPEKHFSIDTSQSVNFKHYYGTASRAFMVARDGDYQALIW